MIRNAYTMKLKPGFAEEYKKRHDELWPEMEQVLKQAGVVEFGIYLDEKTDTLFAFRKLAPNNTVALLPDNDVVRKWWDHMADIMITEPDNAPVEFPLREMFYLA